jgi:hypothetical protein
MFVVKGLLHYCLGMRDSRFRFFSIDFSSFCESVLRLGGIETSFR